MRPKVLEKGLILLAVGSISLSILYFFGIGVEYSNMDHFNHGRISIFGDNANVIGLRMCIAILVITSLLYENRLNVSNFRFLLAPFLLSMFMLLINTGSRVSFVAIILSFALYLFILEIGKLKKVILYLLSIALSYFLIFPFLIKSETLLFRLLQSFYESDLSNRDILWIELYQTINDHSIVGIGKTGYTYLFGNQSPHNVIIEVLVYTGIIGALIFFIFMYNLLSGTYWFSRSTDNKITFVLLVPVFGLILSGQIFDQKFVWILFSYMVSSYVIFKKLIDDELAIT